MALPALRSGALEQVLGECPVPEIWVKALIPENRARIPRVRALPAVLQDSLGETPPWEGEGVRGGRASDN